MVTPCKEERVAKKIVSEKKKRCIGQFKETDPKVIINDDLIREIFQKNMTYIGDAVNENHRITGNGNISYRKRSIRTLLTIHMLRLNEDNLIKKTLRGTIKVPFAIWGDNATILKKHNFKSLVWILEDNCIFNASKPEDWDIITSPFLCLYGNCSNVS